MGTSFQSLGYNDSSGVAGGVGGCSLYIMAIRNCIANGAMLNVSLRRRRDTENGGITVAFKGTCQYIRAKFKKVTKDRTKQ